MRCSSFLIYFWPESYVKYPQIDPNRKQEGITMDFVSAVKAAQEGKKLRRSTWEEDMLFYFKDGICLHSHPYDEDQKPIFTSRGYPYICEKDDALASDWAIIE